MKRFKMLVLTDHRSHSVENSIYALLLALRQNPLCSGIDVASRGNALNNSFFNKYLDRGIFVSPVDASFAYYRDGRRFEHFLRRAQPEEYDVIFLRLPPPVPEAFWEFLTRVYPEKQIINRPSGIRETSSKKFLLRFSDLCPDMQLCRTAEQIRSFAARFPIVLKPLDNYGGRGVLRIEEGRVWEGNIAVDLDAWLSGMEGADFEFLGMRFLPNVSQGDKRIVVCNGEVLGASLRMPAAGSWVCNAAQGGTPHRATLTPEEWAIVRRVTPELMKRGIVMFGIDTLTDDDGRRVLSELNTVSIGGLVQMGRLNEEPVVRRAAEGIWKYIKDSIYGKSPAPA